MRNALLLSALLPLLVGGCKLSPFTFGYKVRGDGVTITRCNKNAAGKLVIPDFIRGKPVKRIGDFAFLGCSSLTRITIPDSVRSIESNPFSTCNSLTAIEVSAGNVNYTGFRGVLFNKEKTTLHAYPAGQTRPTYTIPASVTSIGENAFNRCRSLKAITIPDSVTSIGSYAFLNCRGLKSITIPAGVTSIGDFAFEDCTGLTSVTIGNGVTSIGDYAFQNCTSLTSITIPDSVTSFGRLPFMSCKSLTSITFFGDPPKTRTPTVATDLVGRRTVGAVAANPTIYRKPETKGWGEFWYFRPVKLISEKP